MTGQTAEERSSHKLCGAKRKDGTVCRAFAGQGTSHKGQGRCKFHGGKSPAHNQAAVLAEAKSRMVKLGTPIQDIEPNRALAGLLRATAGHVAWLHAEITGLEDLGTFESKVLLELYDSERDRCARVATACISAGIAERTVRIEEAKMWTLGQALQAAAERAGLDDDQRRSLGKALRQELAAIADQAEDPDDSDDHSDLWATPDGWSTKVAQPTNGRTTP